MGAALIPWTLCVLSFFFSFSFLFSFFSSEEHSALGHWLHYRSWTSFVSSLCASSVCIVILWFCYTCSKTGRYVVRSVCYKEPKNDNILHYKWVQTDNLKHRVLISSSSLLFLFPTDIIVLL